MKGGRSAVRSIGTAFAIARRAGVLALVRRALAKLSVERRERYHRWMRFRAWRSAQRRARIGPITFASSGAPEISVIVIGVSGDTSHVTHTLRSISVAPPQTAYEVIVAVPESVRLAIDRALGEMPAVVVSGTDDASFAVLMNAALALARGKYALIVRAGVVVTADTISRLTTHMIHDGRVGAVVPKVLDPVYRVIESGMKWSEGKLHPIGPGCVESDPSVCVVRSIDASSVALFARMRALASRKRSEASDEPASAIADLVDSVRAAGYDAVCQPAAIVTYPARTQTVERRAGIRRRTVLFMDEVVPRSDRDAGSKRLIAIMRLIRELGFDIVFVPHQDGSQLSAARSLRELGCEVRTHDGDARAALHGVSADIAWIARPHIGERYAPFAASALGARVIYDSVDLHHVRLAREEATLGIATGWEQVRQAELQVIRSADVAVVTSIVEQRLLAECGLSSVVVPVIEDHAEPVAPYESRTGLLFVGNFTHAPNVDAARELAGHLMERISVHLPDVHLELVGFDPDGVARGFRRTRIHVRGHVQSLSPHYRRARVLVAPLRYGAGAKGKIVESIAHGLPVVTSSIGAEGLGLEHGRDIEIADDAEAFAQAVARVYRDKHLWNERSMNAREAAARFSPDAVRPVLAEIFESLMRRGASA